MIRLTTEQAQQIEEALDELRYANNTDIAKTKYYKALATIRAARAQEQAEQEPVAWTATRLWNRKDTWKCSADIEKDLLYAAPVQQAEQEPTVSDGVCGGCAKKAADGWALYCVECWEKAEQPVSQEYQDHLVNQSFDWAAMAAKHQFMEGYRIGLAEMREKCAKVVTEHAPTCSPHWVSYVVAIRAINFEGDTGFRPVSEMIAEHKQDPKKAAAIEKAKMRKAEQKPVAWRIVSEDGVKLSDWIDGAPSEGQERWETAHGNAVQRAYAAPQPMKQEPECKYKKAYIIWQDKTEWVQETAHLKELGMHRADVLRQRIENLQNAATHPVRTKDLTDEEIQNAMMPIEPTGKDYFLRLARAVIAADREKNK